MRYDNYNFFNRNYFMIVFHAGKKGEQHQIVNKGIGSKTIFW